MRTVPPSRRSVYLHNNKLADAGLPDNMFNGSSNVEILILSSNFLRHVPKHLPPALYKLHLKVGSREGPWGEEADPGPDTELLRGRSAAQLSVGMPSESGSTSQEYSPSGGVGGRLGALTVRVGLRGLSAHPDAAGPTPLLVLLTPGLGPALASHFAPPSLSF